MLRKMLAVSALMALAGCDRGVSPTAPDPPESRSPVTIQLTSYEPANGTTLKLGDAIWLFGTYTLNTDKQDVHMSFVLVRDDGASYISGMLGPLSKSGRDWQYNFQFRSDPGWGRAYSFARGHNVSVVFVVGGENMVRWGKDDYSVNWSDVKHKQNLGLTYTVPF